MVRTRKLRGWCKRASAPALYTMWPPSLLLRDVVFGADYVSHRRYPTTLSPGPSPPPPPTPHGRLRRYCCCCCVAAVVLRLRLGSPAYISNTNNKQQLVCCCSDCRNDRARPSRNSFGGAIATATSAPAPAVAADAVLLRRCCC